MSPRKHQAVYWSSSCSLSTYWHTLSDGSGSNMCAIIESRRLTAPSGFAIGRASRLGCLSTDQAAPLERKQEEERERKVYHEALHCLLPPSFPDLKSCSEHLIAPKATAMRARGGNQEAVLAAGLFVAFRLLLWRAQSICCVGGEEGQIPLLFQNTEAAECSRRQVSLLNLEPDPRPAHVQLGRCSTLSRTAAGFARAQLCPVRSAGAC